VPVNSTRRRYTQYRLAVHSAKRESRACLGSGISPARTRSVITDPGTYPGNHAADRSPAAAAVAVLFSHAAGSPVRGKFRTVSPGSAGNGECRYHAQVSPMASRTHQAPPRSTDLTPPA